MRSFARGSSAQRGPVAGVPKNSNKSAEASYLAAGFDGGNLTSGPGKLGPDLEIIYAMFDSENPGRSGDLAGESFAAIVENHEQYINLRSGRHAALLGLLDDIVANHINSISGILQGLGFDEAGVTQYQRAALAAFRDVFPTNLNRG